MGHVAGRADRHDGRAGGGAESAARLNKKVS